MKTICQEKSLEDRIKFLSDHAEKVVANFSWDKKLDEVDLEEFRVVFAEKNIELSDMQNDLASKIQIAKAEMKPIAQDIQKLQNAIKHREMNVVETVYLLADQSTGEMEYYNEEGLCVYTRPLRPEEKQFRIQPASKVK